MCLPDRRRFVLSTLLAMSVLGQHAAGRTPLQETCNAVLDGSKFPELIPDAVAWEAVTAKVAAGQFQETAKALSLSTVAAEAIARTFMNGGAPVTGSTASLAKRDVLTRQLPIGDYRRLRDWVEDQRAELLFAFPISGKLGLPAADGSRRCAIEVRGKEHPELIPESFYWEGYLRVQMNAVGEYRTGAGRVAPVYLKTQQRYHLPMPIEDIRIFFEVADRTVQLLDSASGGRKRNAEIVRDAREELVRRLPESSWRVLLADATARARDVAVYAFPTGLE